MSVAEFRRWADFYQLHPFDDRHRYYRPAALIAKAAGSSMNTEALLEWLEPEPPEPLDAPGHEYSQADVNTMKAFGIKPPRG